MAIAASPPGGVNFDRLKEIITQEIRMRGYVNARAIYTGLEGRLSMMGIERFLTEAMRLQRKAGQTDIWEPSIPQQLVPSLGLGSAPAYVSGTISGVNERGNLSQQAIAQAYQSFSQVSDLLSVDPPRLRYPPYAFKVGEKVWLKQDSEFYEQSDGTQGIIKDRNRTDNGNLYIVEWENGAKLDYPEKDLITAPEKIAVSMDSVILASDKKQEIKAAISQVKHTKKIFEEWGFSEVFEKGTAISLLFFGIPGTGKTLMAQAIADELHMELKMYGTAEIQSSEPGGAERMIKKIFAEAKAAKRKQVILFDECDSLLFDRNKIGAIMAAQVNALLSEIERYEGIVIFTTNRLGKLDPALERRIAAKIEFTFPTEEERFKIWERMFPKKAPIAPDVDIAILATYPLAGGNIKNAVLNAARHAAYHEAKTLSMEHFVYAIGKEKDSLIAFQKAAHPHGEFLTESEGDGLAAHQTELGGNELSLADNREIRVKKKISLNSGKEKRRAKTLDE
jgi:AAA+ superfamily predicted ATPase